MTEAKINWFGFILLAGLGLVAWWAAGIVATATHAAPAVNVITVTTTDDSWFPDGQCSLRKALDNANHNIQRFAGVGECPAGSATETDVIVLVSGQTYTLELTGSGEQEGDLDVLANGLAVDVRLETTGEAKALLNMTVAGQRVMEIHGASVELDNITLVGGSTADNGGGIYNNGGQLHLHKVALDANTANAGGGIYNNNGTVVVSNSSLAGNTGALGGGGIFNNGAQAHLTVTDSNIATNFTNQQGGGIGNSEGAVIINQESTLLNNFAALGGGGASNQDGTFTVVDSTISSNNGGEIGGGLYNWGMSGPTAVMSITNSTISLNGTPNGSGAGVANIDGQLHISGTTINDNTGAMALAYGGGVFAYAETHTTTTSIHASLVHNNEIDNGGGIAIREDVGKAFTTITGVGIYNNKAHYGGGVSASGWYTLIAEESSIALNTAELQGGGMQVFSGDEKQTILDKVVVRANTVVATDGHGGGVFVHGPTGQLIIRNDSQINLNEAGTNGRGGGIYNFVSRVNIADSTVQGNEAGSGGGIYTNEVAHTVVTNTLIADNSASEGGGFYTKEGSTLSIHNSRLIGNHATDGHGGGIWQHHDADPLLVEGSYVAENSSTSSGGGIYTQSEVEIRQSLIVSNTTASSGGGMYVAGDGSTTISDSTFRGNMAGSDGGGASIYGTATIANSTFVGNSANHGGGALYSNTDSTTCADSPATRIINSTFSDNSSVAGGGGIRNYNGLTEILHTTFTANNSSETGGGVYSYNDDATCTRIGHSLIVGNEGSGVADDVGALEIEQRFVSLGHNVIGAAGSNVDFTLEFNVASDQTDVADALLGPLADNGGDTMTHALLEGSPAIGAGDAAVCAAAPANGLDQRGFARGTAACDSGAYEFSGTPPPLAIYLPLVMR